MKHFIFYIILFWGILTQTTYAQLSKNSRLLGGTAGFLSRSMTESGSSGKESDILIRLAPRVGFALSDNLVIGGILSLDYEGGDGYSSTIIKAGPMIRYYLPLQKKLYVFGEGAFQVGTLRDRKSTSSPLLTDFSAGPGLSYFVSRSFALEALLKYAHTGESNKGINSVQTGVKFSIGIQVFLRNE